MNNPIITKIAEKDRVFGKLCLEAQFSYEQGNYFSAIACLFVLSEQIIKFTNNEIDGNFHSEIKKAQETKQINDTEFNLLESLREIRNKVFHENHYPLGLEIDGNFWSFSEDETKKLIYTEFSPSLFQLVLKLLDQ